MSSSNFLRLCTPLKPLAALAPCGLISSSGRITWSPEAALESYALAHLRHCASSSAPKEVKTQAAASSNAQSGTSPNSESYEAYDAEYQAYNDHEKDLDDQHNRDRALRRVLRSANAAELAAVHFFRGYSAVLRSRVDAQYFSEQEQEAAESVRQLLPKYRVRPSLGQGPLSLACLALGAAAAAAPPRIGLAVTGAVGDALSDHYNEQLRQLNEAGAAREAPAVRQALRDLRDLPRTPEGAPPAPDLVSVLQKAVEAAASSGGSSSGGGGSSSGGGGSSSGGGGGGVSPGLPGGVLSGVVGVVREWGVEGTMGAMVKAGTKVALEAAARL